MTSVLFQHPESSDEPQYVINNGVKFECCAINGRQFVRRVISTNPKDYLLYQPGMQIQPKAFKKIHPD